MDKYTKAVLTVTILLLLSGCQTKQERFSTKALYDQVCRNVVNDVSRYPDRIEIRETSISMMPISDEMASKHFDDELFALLKSFNKTGEVFTEVSVRYRLLENGQSNQWACFFHGFQNRGMMQMSTFFDGRKEYNDTDQYYFFKSGASHTDVFVMLQDKDFSFVDKLKFWFLSFME